MKVATGTIMKLWAITWLGVALASPSQPINPAKFATKDIIQRDVVVVGGGSSGTYAAVRLRDANQSVVIVEQKNRLGGHTETYQDPITKAHDDLGVIVFHNLQIVEDYFARFGIPLTLTLSAGGGGGVTQYADLTTGKALPDFVPANFTAAFGSYAQQLAQYPYLAEGFDLPDPVPADLVLPFGDFIVKYSLQSMANFVANFAQGFGNLLSKPTLYIFKYLSLDILNDLSTGFLTTARHDNSELYEKATTFFGQDVLFNSTVIAADRSGSGSVKLVVQTPGGRKLIRATKLVIAIEPVMANLAPFDLSAAERAVFRQFSPSAYYTSAMRNLGIPDNTSINNVSPDALYNIPKQPAIYAIEATGIPNLHNVYYGAATPLSSARVQQNILADVKRLAAAGTASEASTAEFAAFSNHAPFELVVSAEAISKGFYRRLYALQGQRNTFYTGAAWNVHDSSAIWQFTERLIPRIVGS